MSHRKSSRRRLGPEQLERRDLLAGVGGSAWQNPLDPSDLNADGVVAPLDALIAINAINNGGGGRFAGRMAPPQLRGEVDGAATDFLDANGDEQLTPIDALCVILELNRGARPSEPPLEDAQPDAIGDDAAAIELTNGFARIESAINTAGDQDVYRITPTEERLSVALFSRAAGEVSVTIVDAAGETVATATKPADARRPTKLDVAVEAGGTYYIVVSAAAEVTGGYGLHVLNYAPRDFTPVTDAELGDDIHGGDSATATPLSLEQARAKVSSNIDAAGDADVFSVEAVDGQLAIFAAAKFGLTVTVTNSAGEVVGTKASTERGPLVIEATAGTYTVAVAATDGLATGAYRVDVVNPFAPRPRPEHPGGAPEHPAPTPPAPEELFAELDADTSGSLSLAEFAAAPRPGHAQASVDEVFALLDADDDELLSLEEFSAARPLAPPLPPAGGHRPGTSNTELRRR